MKLELDSELIIDHASENTAEGKRGLGRVASVDFRDRRFLIEVPPEKEIDRMERYWITSKPLNQGSKPHCVGFSWTQMLLSSPVKNLPYKTPGELYAECQEQDEWPGSDYSGTSVRAGAKVLKDKGYLSEYRWAFDLERVVYHVMMHGPLVLGVTWYEEMMNTRKSGFIHAIGQVVGGHAVVVKGCDLDRECPDGTLGAFRILNSWGSAWGEGGKCWLSLVDAAKLIADFGEACMATELKFKPQI